MNEFLSFFSDKDPDDYDSCHTGITIVTSSHLVNNNIQIITMTGKQLQATSDLSLNNMEVPEKQTHGCIRSAKVCRSK